MSSGQVRGGQSDRVFNQMPALPDWMSGEMFNTELQVISYCMTKDSYLMHTEGQSPHMS